MVASCLTMPEPSCCSNPLPEPSGPDESMFEGRRDRIDCMLDESRNGTLLEVFGIDPPCFVWLEWGGWFGVEGGGGTFGNDT